MFQKKLEYSLEIEILYQIFIEYKYTTQQCADNFVLDLLISY